MDIAEELQVELNMVEFAINYYIDNELLCAKEKYIS